MNTPAHDATAAQVVAARPDASSWVAANAGSGKTRVLTDRVARLLLAGTEPQKILCLTYTKAAAAEMQTRLFRTLGAWAMMPEAGLRAALTELGEPGETIPADRIERARTLFARALETPGGLKIQTIHAFCDALLRRFPLEAGVSPRFAVLEDRQARALRAEILDELAASGASEIAAIAPHLSGDDLDPLLQEIGRNRAAFAVSLDRAALAAALGVDPDAPDPGLDLSQGERAILAAIVEFASASGTNDRKSAASLAIALATPDTSVRQERLEAALLTGNGAKEPFTPKAFPTKPVRNAHPELCLGLDAIALRVAEARGCRIAAAAFEKTCALHAFARIWLPALSARKAALGLLDFDDLVERARVLLGRPETAAWVLWRLDGGLDHILVDEAQDTSPAQWGVIEAISSEFFVGLSARDVARTIFVVGDEKQSIYSFQGADPAAFARMRGQFDRMLDAMGAALARCDLLYSFRSARPILDLVDAVFAGPAGAGFGAPVRHHAFAAEAPGRVELWPYLEKPEKPENHPWDRPLDMPAPDDPVERLATSIASTIRGWLDSGRALPGHPDGRAIRAGDVLVLVQTRAAPFHAVIRALKRARVPVAGADVLRIGGELAVRDLLAALRVVATSADDLSLAALLRSPLGGFTENDLFALAHGRNGPLWTALNRLRPAPPILGALLDLRAQADFLRPYELLQRLLVRHSGRRNLSARLGLEAEDGIDALLDQALAYESVEPPNLTGFLEWIDRDEVAVKRRTEDEADHVRVMTVHGAKGLEAPIVILPDTAPRQEGANPPALLDLDTGPVWRVKKDDSPLALTAAEDARRLAVAAENRRLLYVALTRARTWLIVAGAGGPLRNGDGWHAMVGDALRGLDPDLDPSPEGPIVSLSRGWTEEPGGFRVAAPPAPDLPAWARTAPPPPLPGTAIVSPSALGGAHALPGQDGLDEADALAWGSALHALLEMLPAFPRSEWPLAAERIAPGAPPDVYAEAEAVLTEPGLARLFGPDALAEVEISAALDALGGARMIGRIDRLVVEPDVVLAIDFKSNRTVPTVPEAVPEAILRQMGAYAAALAAIYPGRRIETAILWTRARRLMDISAPLAAAALSRAGAT